MSRILLLGRAGSGKTHFCLERLAAALERRPRKALLLVPTYGQAEHLRLRLLDRTGGLSARTVLTFSSLAEYVLEHRLAQLVPPPVRDRIAAEVLAEVFPEAAGRPGFRAEFLATVKELRSQGVDPAEGLAKARAHFPDASRELHLFEAYERFVARLPGPDHEQLLIDARDSLRAKAPRLDLFLIDGFHDFTPVEREIVDLMAQGATETVLTLPMDPSDPSDPVFLTASRTARSFEGFERRALNENHRAAGALARLERGLFHEPGPATPGDGIECIACASEEDEADRLARLVLRSGRAYDDFLIVRRSFDGLHGIYRAAFRRHGIPLRFFGDESLQQSPALRAATLWLRLLARGLETRELLVLARSPYLLDRPPREEVDAAAALLREQGAATLEALAGPYEGTLADLWKRIGVRDALVERPDGDEEIARAARLLRQIDAEVEAVRGFPLAEAADAVLRRIPLLRAAAPDRRHRCVFAVEAKEARQWEKPVVMVAGLGADSFPRPVRQDLFLRDEVREALANERDLTLPLRAQREEEERYLFYVALTRAREHLVLTYPAFGEDGTPVPPSPYLEDALKPFDPITRRTVPLAEQYVQAGDAIDRSDLLPIVADGLARPVPSAIAASLHDLGAVPRETLAWPIRHELRRTLPIDPPAARVALSASSINAFLRCPYLYLSGRILRVQPEVEPGLNPRLRGEIAHEVLDRVARRQGDASALFDEVFDRATADFRTGLELLAQRRWLRVAVLNAARRMESAEVLQSESAFEIDIDGVPLRGRIDRVDATPQGPLIRDYKTGSPTLKSAEQFDEVQLDTYLLAAPDAAGAVFERLRRGDAVGFVLDDLDLKGRSILRLDREQLDARRDRMRAIVASVAAAVREGRVAVAPREPEKCTRGQCDGFDLCRVARARWLAKSGRRDS